MDDSSSSESANNQIRTILSNPNLKRPLVVLGAAGHLDGLMVPGVDVSDVHSYMPQYLKKGLTTKGISTVPPTFASLLAGTPTLKVRMTVVENSEDNVELENFSFTSTAAKFVDDRRIKNIVDIGISDLDPSVASGFHLPKVVSDMSLTTYFPPSPHAVSLCHPGKVEQMLILTSAGAQTNWHVDFTGTSVYYCVMTGMKIFYVIPHSVEAVNLLRRFIDNEHQNRY